MPIKTDLGLLGGADALMKGAIEGYERAQDRKMKQMELEAKLNSDKENRERQSKEDIEKTRRGLFDDRNKFQETYGFTPDNQQDIYDKTVISQEQAPQHVDPETGMLQSGFLVKPSGVLTKAEREQQRLDNQDRHQMTMEDLAREGLLLKKQTANKEKGGKLLTDAAVGAMAGYDSAESQLQDVLAGITRQSENMGPIAGRLSSANPYATDPQAFDATMKTAAQEIAKGLEGGKLSDQDIIRYRKMLPNMSDTPELAKKKVQAFQNLIATKRDAALKNYGAAGYKTGTLGSGARAPKGPPKPKSVIQNGHTYILNEATGEYE